VNTTTTAGSDDWRRPGPTPEQRRIDLYIGLGLRDRTQAVVFAYEQGVV
jgi:hypothetical protein